MANLQGQKIKAKITYKEVEEMFANDDRFVMDDSFLNRKGKTQSANPQGQEIKAKITYKEVEEVFANDDGFVMDDSFFTGNL
jgi:hypothetical protein